MTRSAIRRAALADMDALLRLEAFFPGDRLSRRNFRHLLTQGHADLLVYERRGEIVGDAVLLYRRGQSGARLYSLVVRPDQRGRGIGRALIQAAERTARAHRCTELRLEVRVGNKSAQRLYRRLGYLPAGRIEDFYEDHAPALCFRKRL